MSLEQIHALRIVFPVHRCTTFGCVPSFVAAQIQDAAQSTAGNTNNGAFNNVFSSTTTAMGIILVPAAFYSVGLWKNDDNAKQTGLLTAEAAVDFVLR
jgi:hypothetical protein